MGFVEIRDETERYVLFLQNPKRVYQDIFEEHQRSRARGQVEQFLTEATPESAVQDEDKFPTPLRQLKDRNGQVRALGVWCQGDEYDLFIVQVLFDKDDEDKIYAKTGAFQQRGVKLREKFDDRELAWTISKTHEWRDRDDVLLFTASDDSE